MRRPIGQFVASNRSCAVVARSGKAKVSIAEAAGLTMDYSGSAKNASLNMTASVTSGLGNLGEETSDTRNVIELLMGSEKSYAANAKGGKKRVASTREERVRTA